MADVLIKRPRDNGGRGWSDMATSRGWPTPPEIGRQEGPFPGASEGHKFPASRLSGTFLLLFPLPSLWCCATVAHMGPASGGNMDTGPLSLVFCCDRSCGVSP